MARDLVESAGAKSMKVAAILPQSRNLRARLPRRQPVTTPMASVAQRSISTKVTRRLRSRPRGSSMPRRWQPSMAMRTPRIWPAQRWPCAASAMARSSSKGSTALLMLRPGGVSRAWVTPKGDRCPIWRLCEQSDGISIIAPRIPPCGKHPLDRSLRPVSVSQSHL